MTTTGAVKQDLIISAYKPPAIFERRFQTQAGTEAGAWDFVEEHLRHLPLPQMQDGRLEVLAERQAYLLYDRMVAFHIQRGLTVPLSATELYAAQRAPPKPPTPPSPRPSLGGLWLGKHHCRRHPRYWTIEGTRDSAVGPPSLPAAASPMPPLRGGFWLRSLRSLAVRSLWRPKILGI